MNIPKAKRIKLAKLLALVQEIPTEEGAVLFIEGDLAVDAEVFVSDADGNMVPAPDGTYTSEGKTIVVASGKITEIKEAEADPIDNQEPENPKNMEGKGGGEGKEGGEGGDPTDTDNLEELRARIAELEAEVAQKDSKIAELEAKIAELEKEPAAESIEDEEKKERKFGKNKDLTLTQRLLKAAHSNN